MSRARPSSIVRATRGQYPGLARHLRRWLAQEFVRLDPELARSAAACQADRYRKHFLAAAHAKLLLTHGLSGHTSLEESYASFALMPGIATTEGQPPCSYSQLMASNTSRPPALLAGLIPALAARVQAQVPSQGFPPDLRVLDSSFLRLSVKLAPWLTPSQKRVGIQQLYTPAQDLPGSLLIQPKHRNDYQGMDELLLEDPPALAAVAGTTLIFDLGYYSHHRFAALLDADIHLLTRLHPQAAWQVLAEQPVQDALWDGSAGRIRVERDQRIRLGSPNNRRTPRLLELRLVIATVQPTAQAAKRGATAVTYQLVTDRWDLTAQEVVQCYLWRWQIELFFRWLKRTIGLIRLVGYSQQAVECSIYLAIVVHLLTVLAAQALGFGRRNPSVRIQLAHALIRLADEPWPAPPLLSQLALPGFPTGPPLS